MVLNSVVGLYQLKRIGTGGVQTNISYRDIKNILIPVLPKETQQKIAELVRKSYQARKKSKELLEEAKRKVEEIIERRITKVSGKINRKSQSVDTVGFEPTASSM